MSSILTQHLMASVKYLEDFSFVCLQDPRDAGSHRLTGHKHVFFSDGQEGDIWPRLRSVLLCFSFNSGCGK